MKELTLEITGKCDSNCPWCSSDAKSNGKHVPKKQVESLLMKYKVECDVVRFSGGEPTLHPNLEWFCSLAKKLGYYTVLLTNGSQECVPVVDMYVIGVINDKSLRTAMGLNTLRTAMGLNGVNFNVRMEVVMVEGNEALVFEAMRVSMLAKIPLRLLVLQNQGRGKNCRPIKLISWTGDEGCRRDEKISILHDGRVIACSALKEGECVVIDKIRQRALNT